MLNLKRGVVTLLAALTLSACSGEAGDPGLPGEQGPQGPQGPEGPQGPQGPDSRVELQLPDNRFFPEGIAIAPDGTIFIGSVGTGQIVRFAPGATRATPFAALGQRNAVGLLVEPARSLLWVCDSDATFQSGSRVKAFDLASGADRGTYPLPGGGFCNDMTLDGQGNLYVTDSTGSRINKLVAGGTQLTAWSENAAYVGGANEFTLNGIAWDGQSAIYVTKYSSGQMFRVGINADGTAAAPTELTVTRALVSPDGLKRLNANTLLVVEGNGNLTRLAISGNTLTPTVVANRLDSPTTVDLLGDSAWVVEGQLGVLLGLEPGPADLPFRVRRVWLY